MKFNWFRSEAWEEILGMDFVKHQSGLDQTEKDFIKTKIEALRSGESGR